MLALLILIMLFSVPGIAIIIEMPDKLAPFPLRSTETID